MPMTPEQKAKQKARQEAEWAKQRGEVPVRITSLGVDDDGNDATEQFAEPEMPVSHLPEPAPKAKTKPKAELIPKPKAPRKAKPKKV